MSRSPAVGVVAPIALSRFEKERHRPSRDGQALGPDNSAHADRRPNCVLAAEVAAAPATALLASIRQQSARKLASPLGEQGC